MAILNINISRRRALSRKAKRKAKRKATEGVRRDAFRPDRIEDAPGIVFASLDQPGFRMQVDSEPDGFLEDGETKKVAVYQLKNIIEVRKKTEVEVIRIVSRKNLTKAKRPAKKTGNKAKNKK